MSYRDFEDKDLDDLDLDEEKIDFSKDLDDKDKEEEEEEKDKKPAKKTKKKDDDSEKTDLPAQAGEGDQKRLLFVVRNKLESLKHEIDNVVQLINQSESFSRIKSISSSDDEDYELEMPTEEEAGRVIEGVFDGQNMIGPDGKHYSMPANYASKSKLVEGDILKLTINSRGAFIYKQIGPIDRTRLVGILKTNDDGRSFEVDTGDRTFKVLTAAVTYFKGEANDEAVILVPQNTPSHWAAIENVIKRGGE